MEKDALFHLNSDVKGFGDPVLSAFCATETFFAFVWPFLLRTIRANGQENYLSIYKL